VRKTKKPIQFIETGHRKTNTTVLEVDNPHYSPEHDGRADNPKKVNARINTAESPLLWYHARKHIDDVHLRAGSDVRRFVEAAGQSGAKAIDFTKEIVDGSGAVSDEVVIRFDAAEHLVRISRLMSADEYRFLRKVCAESIPVRQIAINKRHGAELLDRLRGLLDVVAEYRGYGRRV